jgi:hypothetical protein
VNSAEEEMKLRQMLPLACGIYLVTTCQLLASDQQHRFLEIQMGTRTETYDLATVQAISPGRFTIMETSIATPDVVKFELKVLNTLRTYCEYSDGKYPAPPDLFVLGPPDLPVQQIEVKSSGTRAGAFKYVQWEYPYRRYIIRVSGQANCKRGDETEATLFREAYAAIVNGVQSKELYDCKRGLHGGFADDDDPPAKAITGPVRKGTNGLALYQTICRAVMHEEPYAPPD